MSYATVKAAFDSPECLNGVDAVYAGGDFTHTQIGSYWSLSLASLTGATCRSIQSGYITLNASDRYVIHVGDTPFGPYGNFGQVTIRKYDSSGNHLGYYDPAGYYENPPRWEENLCLTGAAKIKIRVTLRRAANSSATNPTTELCTDQFQFWKLTNDAATTNLDTSFDSETHWQLGHCSDPVIQNCEFRFMGRAPISLASCQRAKIRNNRVHHSWTGFASTNSSDTVLKATSSTCAKSTPTANFTT